MFATIRRHQKWLYAVIATITIASFVVFMGKSGTRGGGDGRGPGQFGSIGGHEITMEELNNAKQAVQLSYFLEHGHWPDMDSVEAERSVNFQAYIHLFMEQKMRDLGVIVTPEATANFYRRMFPENLSVGDLARRILEQRYKQKDFSPQMVDQAVDDLDRVLRFDLGRSQLMLLTGMYGYLMTPQEAEMEFRNDNQEVQTSMAFYSASNFLASVPANAGAVATYYTNHLAEYRIPERAQVEYVKFNVTNYLDAAKKAITNLDVIADAYEKEHGTNWFGGAKTAEESRSAVKNEYVREHALVDARHDAYAFATELDDIAPKVAANLGTLAAKKGMNVITPAPFDRENGPQDSSTPLQFVRAAFARTPDEPFAPPITTEDGVYVLALKAILPSEVPSFTSIEKKVEADYRHQQALTLAGQAAVKLFGTYETNAMPKGISFASACKEAKVNLEPLPPFSRVTTTLSDKVEDLADINTLKAVAFNTPVGQISPPARGHDGVFLLSVDKLLPFDEAKFKSEFPAFLTRVRQLRMNDAFNQWLNLQITHDQPFAQLLRELQQEAQKRSVSAAKS